MKKIKEFYLEWKTPIVISVVLFIIYLLSANCLPSFFTCKYYGIFPPVIPTEQSSISTQASPTLILNPGTTGPIGDTFGGILGPFVALLAAIITFFAFWVQYKANEQQRKDIALERFESRYYEMLRLHRANVEEMNIADKVKGRKCFIHMFYELEFCYKSVEKAYNNASNEDKANFKYKEINLMSFSYKIFFYGTGVHSEKHFIEYLSAAELHLYKTLKDGIFKEVQGGYLTTMQGQNVPRYHSHPISGNADSKSHSVEFYYYPLDGHINRLGHYYRLLFQTVSYITSNKNLTSEEKYNYIKTLRAQLSNFEQLLLYYNALAWFDEEWRLFFTEYRFIKNLPLPLADFHERPEKHFEKEIGELRKRGIEMFELYEG